MKRVFCFLLALAMTLSLAACGGGGKSGGTAEVVFWHSLSGPVGDELQKIVDEYNAGQGAEKNVHVTAVYQGYDGTDKQILAYQTNDKANACDINVGLTSTIPSMMELDWTVKVSDLYKDGSWVPQDSFPATLDELISYTEALTEKSGSEVSRYGFECQVKRYQLVNYICAQSTDAYFGDLEGGRAGAMTKITAGENGTLKAFLEKWDKLVETGRYQYVEGTVAEEFANETTAMALFSSSKVTNVLDLVGDKFNWNTAPIPLVNAGDTGSSAVGGSCLVLFDRGDKDRVAGAIVGGCNQLLDEWHEANG